MKSNMKKEASEEIKQKKPSFSVVRIDLNMSRPHWATRKEGNVLLNDALNTFYLRLYLSDIW